MHRNTQQSGFSLLEAVIALGVASYALIAAYSAFSGGAVNLRTSNQRIAMTLFAEAKLAETIFAGIEQGITSGVTPEGFQWQQTVDPYLVDRTEVGLVPLPINDQYGLYRIEIIVSSGSGASVVLKTLKGRSLNVQG